MKNTNTNNQSQEFATRNNVEIPQWLEELYVKTGIRQATK